MPYIGTYHKTDVRIFKYGKPLSEDKYTFNDKLHTFSTLEEDVIIYIDNVSDFHFQLGNRAVLINNNNYADISVTCLDNCHLIINSCYILSCGENCIVTVPCLGKSITLDNQVVDLEDGNIKTLSRVDINHEEDYFWPEGIYKDLKPDPFSKRRSD